MAASSQPKIFFVAIKRSCFLAGKGILGGKMKGGAPNAFATCVELFSLLRLMHAICKGTISRYYLLSTPALFLLFYDSYQEPISNNCIHTHESPLSSFDLRPPSSFSSLRAATGDDFGDRAPPRPSTMPLNDRAKVMTPSSNLAEQMGLRSREKGFIVYWTYKSWS